MLGDTGIESIRREIISALDQPKARLPDNQMQET
jgi:hypothetical protein